MKIDKEIRIKMWLMKIFSKIFPKKYWKKLYGAWFEPNIDEEFESKILGLRIYGNEDIIRDVLNIIKVFLETKNNDDNPICLDDICTIVDLDKKYRDLKEKYIDLILQILIHKELLELGASIRGHEYWISDKGKEILKKYNEVFK